MIILDKQITVDELMQIESERYFDYMVKAVVDVKNGIDKIVELWIRK